MRPSVPPATPTVRELAPSPSLPSAGIQARRPGSLALTRRLALGIWSPSDLLGIVGAGWTGEPGQAEALAAFVRAAVPRHHHVALGEIWTIATSSLADQKSPPTAADAARLVYLWRRQAARRADEWRRPRSQRPKKGRRSERPVSDLTGHTA